MKKRLSLLTGSLTSIFASDAITDVSPETVGSALVNVETKAYEADYQDITFDELLPVINLNDETATSFEYMYVTKAGKAQLAKGDGSIAWVDSYLGAKNVKLYDGNTGYKYPMKDVRRAMKLGQSLDAFKAQTAIQASLELAEEIAYNGDTERDIAGFWTYDGFASTTALDNQAGTSKLWASKTPLEKLADINHLFGTAYSTTKKKEFKPKNKSNRLVLSVEDWTSLASTPLNNNTTETVLSFIVSKCPYLDSMDQVIASAECPRSMIRIYQKDQDKIAFYWGHTINFKAPQHLNLELRVPADFSIGGLVVRKPLSVWDLKGIA